MTRSWRLWGTIRPTNRIVGGPLGAGPGGASEAAVEEHRDHAGPTPAHPPQLGGVVFRYAGQGSHLPGQVGELGPSQFAPHRLDGLMSPEVAGRRDVVGDQQAAPARVKQALQAASISRVVEHERLARSRGQLVEMMDCVARHAGRNAPRHSPRPPSPTARTARDRRAPGWSPRRRGPRRTAPE